VKTWKRYSQAMKGGLIETTGQERGFVRDVESKKNGSKLHDAERGSDVLECKRKLSKEKGFRGRGLWSPQSTKREESVTSHAFRRERRRKWEGSMA